MAEKSDFIKNFFDPAKYATMLVGAKNNSKDQTSLFDLLTLPEHKELKIDALKLLKEQKALTFLMDHIRHTNSNIQKKVFLSAIWEAGLDAREELLTLIDIGMAGDFEVCFEVLTIIENFEPGVDAKQVKEALVKLATYKKSDNKQDLIESIKQVLNSL